MASCPAQRGKGFPGGSALGFTNLLLMLQLAFAVALFVLGIIVAALGIKRLAEKQTAKA